MIFQPLKTQKVKWWYNIKNEEKNGEVQDVTIKMKVSSGKGYNNCE